MFTQLRPVSEYVIMCAQLDGTTALIASAWKGLSEVASELIKAKAEINHKSKVRIR